jgi:hypothetical protein
MAAWTDYKSLTNKSRTKVQGTIADTPALGFGYKYSVLAVFDQVSLGFGFSQQTAKLRVQILAPDETTVLFDSTISLRYTLVTLDLGGVTLFTWNVDIQNGAAVTTVPEAFLTVATEQPNAIPGGGSDYTDNDCIVQFDLYSGLYLIPLPAGAIFKVKFHNEGMAGLTYLPVQTTVLPGGGIEGTRLMQDGMFRLVRVATTGTGLRFIAGCDVRGLGASGAAAWDFSTSAAPTTPQVESLVTERLASAYQLVYLRQRPTVLYNAGRNLWAQTSDDDGATWGMATELTTGFDFTAADIGPDGGTVYVIGKRGNTTKCLICSLERDAAGVSTLRLSEEFEPAGLEDLAAGRQFLKLQNGVFHLLTDNAGSMVYYRSEDGMRTFQ